MSDRLIIIISVGQKFLFNQNWRSFSVFI